MFSWLGTVLVRDKDENMAKEVARIITVLQTTFLTGFILGAWSGARRASLQFQAEHQHMHVGIKTRREAATYHRLRTARVMWGASREGLRRGMQICVVASVFEGARWGSSAVRERLAFNYPIDEIIAGLCAGSLFALAGRGQRMYHLRKGMLLGGSFGLLLSSLNYFSTRMKPN